MRRNNEMDRLLNEMAMYKTELAKGSAARRFQRIQAIIQSIPDINISNPQGCTYLMAATVAFARWRRYS